ncbi:hypothetical protein [Streptomyces liangshanensis]|uniref:hypothetical protein n=1 Tax=Streptomyces liangshanensis TaxID=2717324 RepID=UPI0031333E6F
MYESHVTVLCGGDELGRLERWAARRGGVKFTHIELARGRTSSQPMLTLCGSRASYADEVSAVNDMVGQLARDGFAVARVKVECAPWAAEVPRGGGEVSAVGGDGPAAGRDVQAAEGDGPAAGAGRGGRHFEHHVKLLLDPAYDREALVALAVRHGAHVSRNARRRREDGREERFVTQRCHDGGSVRAELVLDALLADLRRYEVVHVEREYVLLDSGPQLDEGWLGSA